MTISDEAVEAAARAFHGALDAPVSRPEDWSDQMRAALEAAAPFIQAEALEEAADEAEAIITAGDIAECAAHVPGERGRQSAVDARDQLYNDPEDWLRARAAAERGGE